MEQYKCPFQVGDSVIPVKPLDPSEGPGWSDGMDFMVGNVYTIHVITWIDGYGYYEARLGTTDKERMWYWKDTWLKPIDYSLF